MRGSEADGRQPEHEGAIGSAAYARRRRVHRSPGHIRPRVLQLLATGGSGGAQESYGGLLLHLDRGEYDVEAVSLSPGPAVSRLRRLGFQVDVLSETDDQAAVAELAALLRRREIDLIHNHMYRAEVVGTRAAIEADTPVIVGTVHSSRVRSPEDVATLRELTPHMDRLLVPSTAIGRKVAAEGRSGAQVTVIPNGIPLERFTDAGAPAVRAELGVRDGEVLIGVVARLEPEKGHRYLLDAVPIVLAACPGARFVIAGEGSLGDELRRQAAALPARAGDRVLLLGRRDDVVAVTAALDIAVLPSLREAQGLSILEAMALRKPVIASAVGGIPEVIRHRRSGILVPPANPARLARAILALALNPVLRRRIGEAGYRTVLERYSIQAMVRRVGEVYDEELARAGVAAGASIPAAEPPLA